MYQKDQEETQKVEAWSFLTPISYKTKTECYAMRDVHFTERISLQ